MFEKYIDWAISSEASNRGTFRDYPKGVGIKPEAADIRKDEDIVRALSKGKGRNPLIK